MENNNILPNSILFAFFLLPMLIRCCYMYLLVTSCNKKLSVRAFRYSVGTCKASFCFHADQRMKNIAECWQLVELEAFMRSEHFPELVVSPCHFSAVILCQTKQKLTEKLDSHAIQECRHPHNTNAKKVS